MLTERTFLTLLPWWLFGYLAAALWVCLCMRWARPACALFYVTLGAPSVAMATVVLKQFLPTLLCEFIFIEYLLVILSWASAALFGVGRFSRATQTLAWCGLWLPLAFLARLISSFVKHGSNADRRGSGRD